MHSKPCAGCRPPAPAPNRWLQKNQDSLQQSSSKYRRVGPTRRSQLTYSVTRWQAIDSAPGNLHLSGSRLPSARHNTANKSSLEKSPIAKERALTCFNYGSVLRMLLQSRCCCQLLAGNAELFPLALPPGCGFLSSTASPPSIFWLLTGCAPTINRDIVAVSVASEALLAANLVASLALCRLPALRLSRRSQRLIARACCSHIPVGRDATSLNADSHTENMPVIGLKTVSFVCSCTAFRGAVALLATFVPNFSA